MQTSFRPKLNRDRENIGQTCAGFSFQNRGLAQFLERRVRFYSLENWDEVIRKSNIIFIKQINVFMFSTFKNLNLCLELMNVVKHRNLVTLERRISVS